MSSTKIKVVGVFGYNNTRIYDVKKIRDLAKSKYDVETLLIKEGITPADLDVTPYCFDHRPEDPKMSSALIDYLKSKNLILVGCLPFSDKGVIGAAHVAEALSLFGDDAPSSLAMLDKHMFRNLESQINLDSLSYKKPFYQIVKSKEDLENLLKVKGKFFLKPVAEGNSRGCMKIESKDDLDLWMNENSQWLTAGAICEELLSLNSEFSFDGVAGNYWITEKFTTSGEFRAEYQHIVPAPLSDERRQSVHCVLESLIQQLGSRGGAFHHEFFILQDGRIASVEPNRRPAGMWLWDLATTAFENFSPWEQWLDKCLGYKQENQERLKQKSFSGVRGIISKVDGILESIDILRMENELDKEFGREKYRLSVTKSEGSKVRCHPRDNSDFVAMISLSDPSYESLITKLERAEQIILKYMRVR